MIYNRGSGTFEKFITLDKTLKCACANPSTSEHANFIYNLANDPKVVGIVPILKLDPWNRRKTLTYTSNLPVKAFIAGVLNNQDLYLITEAEDAVFQEHLMTINSSGFKLQSIQRFAKMPGFDTLSMEATAQYFVVRGRAKAGNQTSTVFFYDRRPSDGVIAPSWSLSGEFTATSLVEVLGENYLYTAQAEEKSPVSLYTIGPLKLRVSTPEALTDGLLTFNGISQGQTRNLRITDLYLTPQEQI